MAKRSGSLKTLRAAATYVANDTWYAVTNVIQTGQEANSLMLYLNVTVASAGNVEFKIEHTPGDPTSGTYYEFGTGGETPEIFGPVAFTAVDAKSLIIPGIMPNEQIKVYFRCSAGAASAKLEIIGQPFLDESGLVNTDVSFGDIQVQGGTLSKTVATGAAAIAASTGAFSQPFELDNITLHLSAAGTTSENFTVTLNAVEAAGGVYDTVLVTQDLSTDSVVDLVLTPEEDGLPKLYATGDSIDVAWPNTETRTYGLRIVGKLV
ncbi:MAG: hypothetical protein ACYTG7_26220 [Planctomycetota bacterium]|jgi:hypothetical protein